MTVPVTLTFRHLLRSGVLESSARNVGDRLQQLHHRITACHIVLEGKADAPEMNAPHHVKIHVSLPGAEIHAESVPRGSQAESSNALHSAYENAKRQLEKLKGMHSRPSVTGRQ
jgi:ribosome-associated translation inhibitor RaiA